MKVPVILQLTRATTETARKNVAVTSGCSALLPWVLTVALFWESQLANAFLQT